LRVESCKTQNPSILKLIEMSKSLVAIDKTCNFHMDPQSYRCNVCRHNKMATINCFIYKGSEVNEREATCCPKTSTDATLPQSFEPSVYKYAVSNFGKYSDRKRPTVAPLFIQKLGSKSSGCVHCLF
jgi:hypothetical protein